MNTPDYVAEQVRDFTGRRWVFEALEAWLADPHGAQVLGLVGMLGTGKTAIMVRLAQGAALDEFPRLAASRPVFSHFCRWQDDRTINPLRFVDGLCQRLAQRHQAFAQALLNIGDEKITINSTLSIGSMADGATAKNVVIEALTIRNLSARLAFDRVIRGPLETLYASGFREPIVIAVDAINEALTFPADEQLADLLAAVADDPGEVPDNVRFLFTTVPDRRVLAGLEGHARILDLQRDAPRDLDEIADYAAHRLAAIRDGRARDRLAHRISTEAHGNFLYAYHVLQPLLRADSTPGLSSDQAAALPLPQGGLHGVYREFLRRELARNDAAWNERYAPIFGPLVVAQGEGLTTEQLARAAEQLTGKPFSVSRARDVAKATGQFLSGARPDGPFVLYHRSFGDFLIDAHANPDYVLDDQEAHHAIVRSYLAVERDLRDEYAWRHLVVHAYRAGARSQDYAVLFQLADGKFLEDKARRVQFAQLMRDDYECLFDACESCSDMVRLARYAASRSSLDTRRAMLETEGAARLMLMNADAGAAEEVLMECMTAAALVIEPLHRAQLLISLFEDCPRELRDHELVRSIPDRAWQLLESCAEDAPDPSERACQIYRLVKAVASLQPARTSWAETIAQALSGTYWGDGWIALATSYLAAGNHPDALRCLRLVIETFGLPSRETIDGVLAVYGRIPRDEVPGLAVAPEYRYADPDRAALLAAGLDLYGGAAPRAVRVILTQIDAAQRTIADPWQRALAHSDHAVLFGHLQDASSIQEIGAALGAALDTLEGVSRARMAARLVTALAALVDRGQLDPVDALGRMTRAGAVELGICRAELLRSIQRCVERGAFDAVFAYEANLPLFRLAQDRATVAAQLIAAHVTAGDLAGAEALFRAEHAVLLGATSRARAGGLIALAAVPRSVSAAELIAGAFQDLRTIKDGFDRVLAIENMVANLEGIADRSVIVAILLQAIHTCRSLDSTFKCSALTALSRASSVLIPAEALPQITRAIQAAFGWPSLSRHAITATSIAARMLCRVDRRDPAARWLAVALEQFGDSVDERSKWMVSGVIAETCCALADAAALRRLFELVLAFEAPYWAAKAFGQIAERLRGGPYVALIEELAPRLLAKIEHEQHSVNAVVSLTDLVDALAVCEASPARDELIRVANERSARLRPLVERLPAHWSTSPLRDPLELARQLRSGAIWSPNELAVAIVELLDHHPDFAAAAFTALRVAALESTELYVFALAQVIDEAMARGHPVDPQLLELLVTQLEPFAAACTATS